MNAVLKTGLTDKEWEFLHRELIMHLPKELTFEDWKKGVIDEGKNRQIVFWAATGRPHTLRDGVSSVVTDILTLLPRGTA